MSWSNRALKAARDYFGWGLTYDHLKDFGNVPPFIHTHLKKVYFTLSGALAFMSIGYGLNIYTHLGGIVTILGIIGSSAWFWKTEPWREAKRVRLLMVIGFCIGVSLDEMIGHLGSLVGPLGPLVGPLGPLIGPLIRMDEAVAGIFGGASLGRLIKFFIRVDQRNIFVALIGNAMIFGGFGLAATSSQRRLELFLLGVLYSLALVGILLLPAKAYEMMVFNFGWFTGYVVAYSQEIVVQARGGNNYFTQHAVALYLRMIPFIHNLACILVGRLLTWLWNLIRRN